MRRLAVEIRCGAGGPLLPLTTLTGTAKARHDVPRKRLSPTRNSDGAQRSLYQQRSVRRPASSQKLKRYTLKRNSTTSPSDMT